LTVFLEDLLAPLGCKERRHWARVYVQGLLLDGERKSIEPLAGRIAGADVQALRQFEFSCRFAALAKHENGLEIDL
jgi:hypothetical protein